MEIKMKKIIAALILALSAIPALAQHHGPRHGHWHHKPHYHSGWGWVTPALIGGAVVYMATRPDPVIVQQPPVIVQQPPVIMPQTNTVIIDGVAYTKQIMIINGVQQEVLIRN
jgi:hypothetical protein